MIEQTRTVWIRRANGRPVRMWVIWGSDTSGLNWDDSRWREFEDGECRMSIGPLPPIPFRVIDGRAYLETGQPFRLNG